MISSWERWARRSRALMAGLVLSIGPALAQVPYEVQDGVRLDLASVIPGDTISPETVAAAYLIQMGNDSSFVQYFLTEIRHNADKPRLLSWQLDAEHLNWSAQTLSDSSRTETFVVRTGDTISAYRELMWANTATAKMDTTLVLEDTLDYAVVLLRSDGTRAAVLDSMGVEPCPTRARPTFFGDGPIMKKLSYVVPAFLDSTAVRVGIRITARGSGTYKPVRIDTYTVLFSDRLTSTGWAPYREMFNTPFAKRAVVRQSDPAAAGIVEFDARSGEGGSIRIEVLRNDATEEGRLQVFSSNGELMADEPLGPKTTGTRVVPVRSTGVYFVTLVYGTVKGDAKRVEVVR